MLKTTLEKLVHEANLTSLSFRRALRSAIVVFLSVVLYRSFSLPQGYWITLTAVIIVQSTVGATLRKSFQRFLGTLLGVSIASLLLFWVHQGFLMDVLVILFLFLTYFFNPYTNLINYGFVVIPISITVVFLMALVTPEKLNASIFYARLYDTVIGAALGVLGSFFLFPNKVKGEFNTSKAYLKQQFADYFKAIMDMFLNVAGAQVQARSKKMYVEAALLSDRQFYLERIYEMHFRFAKYEAEKQFIEMSERIAQRLFSLHHRARYQLDFELFKEIEIILPQLREAGYGFLNGEMGARQTLSVLVKEMQKRLADMVQKQDNMPIEHWQDVAALANLNFMLSGLMQDMHQVKDEQRLPV